jgi:protein-S-isoprenylcysteine O-methyltransferase Ste14
MGVDWFHSIVGGLKVLLAPFWDSPLVPSRFFFPIACDLWTVLGLYWLVCAFKGKSVKAQESIGQRLSHAIPGAIGLALLFSYRAHYSWLGIRFVPDTVFFGVAGVALTAAGVGLARWSRFTLGENWSASVIIREDHELIRKGPYRTMRHPIYTGFLLGLLGTVLVIGEVRGLLAFVIIWAGLYGKARREERWLAQEFGEKLEPHLRKTGMFLPRWS